MPEKEKGRKMTNKINRWPQWFDLAQSITGILLVFFIGAHLVFESSILLGKDAMYQVARLFEGEHIFGKPYPILITLIALVIAFLIGMHAVLAIRKFPASYREYHLLNNHIRRFRHMDTLMWYLQVITGFILFFVIPVHLYQPIMHPADIGPYISSDRIWSGRMWPLYLVLLFVVLVHAGIGFYRLTIKWGLLPIYKQPSRHKLRTIVLGITTLFFILGLLTLAKYMHIGAEHAPNAGERYLPDNQQTSTHTPK